MAGLLVNASNLSRGGSAKALIDKNEKSKQNERQLPILSVECYAGYRADESPKRFFIGTRKIEIVEILDRWLDPDYRYFKVRGSDDGIYILRHDINANYWELTLFDSGSRDETRLSST